MSFQYSDLVVSAIMPTKGRQQWAREAVDMFLAQTWPNKELVVIDDPRDPSFPDGVEGPGIEYRKSAVYQIGGKRNLACSLAIGDIICHWDSDDIYRADRIEHQVGMLTSGDYEAVGYNVMEFVRPDGTTKFCHCTPDYTIGVSLMYWRETWRGKRFHDISAGEDDTFKEGLRRLAAPADGRIIARAHHGNTIDKLKSMDSDRQQWKDAA